MYNRVGPNCQNCSGLTRRDNIRSSQGSISENGLKVDEKQCKLNKNYVLECK